MSAFSTTFAARLLAFSVAMAVTPPLLAQSPVPVAAEFSAASFATDTQVASAAPQLTSINYERLYRRLVQAGMLSQVLGYSVTVDADGRPVDCSFSRRFRMLATEREVCRSLLRSVSFEPARDAQGNRIAGTYKGELEIASFFQPD